MERKRGREAAAAAAIVAGGMAAGAYGISHYLVRVAADRSYKSRLEDNPFARELMTRLSERRGLRRGEGTVRGKGMSDFTEEIIEGTRWFAGENPEKITITSFDGLKLTGFYLPSEEKSDKYLILMHGFRAAKFRDFGCLVRFFHEQGYHLLVPDQRSHGESEGRYICYGVKERYDVKQWAEYVAARFGARCRIVLGGISMGGASVLMASGLGLPEQVKGIIADCSFTSPWEIVRHVMRNQYHLPWFPFLPVADRICRKKAGFSLKEYSTLEAMRTNRLPILFIHGVRDDFVPPEMTLRNYTACSAPKKLLLIDAAAHAASNIVDKESYRKAAVRFIEEVTGGES